MTDSDKLKLFTIAEVLEEYEIDNGPNGSSRPFINEARTLRKIANGTPQESEFIGDFRDAPWEQR